jgi:hypothetical protein
MKPGLIAVVVAALFFGAVAAQAGDAPGQKMKSESGPGASEYTPKADADSPPGKQMQEDTGPGASEYAPGHDNDSDDGPGASEDAPGHNK